MLSVVVPIADVVVVGTLVASGVRDISAYAVAFVVVACSELVVAARLLTGKRRIGSLFDTTLVDVRVLLAFSIPLVVTQIFYFSIRSVDVLLLGLIQSPEAAGLYSPVMRLAESATKVLSAFPLLFVPVATAYVARKQTAALHDLYVSVTKWAYLIGFPLILVMVVSPGPVLGLLFGEEYAGLGSVARILAVGYWVVLVTGLNGVTLSAIGAIKDMAVASAIGLGLTLGIGVVLVRSFGPVGAATTNTIAYIFANVAFSVLLFRRTKVTPFRSDSSKLFLYSSAVLVASIVLVELVLPDTAAWSLGVSFLASACWFVGGLFGRPFAMEWSEMRRVVSRGKAGPPEVTSTPSTRSRPLGSMCREYVARAHGGDPHEGQTGPAGSSGRERHLTGPEDRSDRGRRRLCPRGCRVDPLDRERSIGPARALGRELRSAAGAERGLELARGRYWATLDDDDEWLPGKWETQRASLFRFGSVEDVVAIAGIVPVSASGEGTPVPSTAEGPFRCDGLTELFERVRVRAFLNTYVVPTALMRRVGGYDPRLIWGEHTDVLIRLSEVARFVGVDHVSVRVHRAHEADETRVGRDEALRAEGVALLLEKHADAFAKAPGPSRDTRRYWGSRSSASVVVRKRSERSPG